MRRWLLWLPLALFAIVVIFAVRELRAPADRTVYSAMVGKPVPDFALAPIALGKPGLSVADLRSGQPRLLNIFASFVVSLALLAMAGGVASLGWLGSAVALGSVVALVTLEFIVAFLQAFVFAALTCVYLNDVVNLDSH